MHLVVNEESSSRLTWEGRSALVGMLVGLLAGWVALTALLAPSPSPWRWPLIAGVGGLSLGLGGYLSWKTPLWERGLIERAVEGGTVRRERRWLFRRAPVVEELSLATVAAFRLETRLFEETAGRVYPQARLWAQGAGAELLLTDWGEPAELQALAEDVAHTARRPLE